MFHLIEDIENARENKCYFSALALLLTVPDILGKREFPEKSVNKRYIQWFDKYITPLFRAASTHKSFIYPHIDGNLCYQLRCSYLHSGDIDIVPSKVVVNHFNLYFPVEGEPEQPTSSFISDSIDEINITLNVDQFIIEFCSFLRSYLNEHKDIDMSTVINYRSNIFSK